MPNAIPPVGLYHKQYWVSRDQYMGGLYVQVDEEAPKMDALVACT